MEDTKSSRGYVPLLFSAIVASVYLGFMIPYHFLTAPANVEELARWLMDKTGISVEFSMVLPHLICFGAALLFNFLGAVFLKRLLVLFSIILYIASIVLFYPYGPFAVAAIFFSLIGMFRIRRKRKKKSKAQPDVQPVPEAQPAAQAKAQTAPEPQPAAQPEVQATSEAQPETQMAPETQPMSQPEVQTAPATQTEAQTTPEPQPATQPTEDKAPENA